MKQPYQSSILDSYRVLFRDLKIGWEKNGGKICTIVGTTGLFLTGVHSCIKTYKIHDELVANGEKIRNARIRQDGDKKLSRVWRVTKETVKCAAKTSKHYVPDIVGGTLSAYANAKGWHKEHQHYQQAAAMVGVLAADFMAYRQNVISDLGAEADRKYLTKKSAAKIDAKNKDDAKEKTAESGDGLLIDIDPSMLKIKYSRETTPNVWSESHVLRMNHLEQIRNKLDYFLIYGGYYTVNDVRREFYGKKGDIPAGALFGRVWQPGNSKHPERGRKVNLHYEDDEDFMNGFKDWTYIIIEIDDEPVIETINNESAEDRLKRLPLSGGM